MVMPLSSHLPFSSVKARVAIVSPEAMPGRSSFLAASSPACSSSVGGEGDGREVRRAQQAAAHLLEHDGELDVAEALAAELLGDDQALEPELVGHLGPDRGVVALGGLHEAADLGLGRLGSRNWRTMRRSSSCSSEKAKFMARILLAGRCRPPTPLRVHLCTHERADAAGRARPGPAAGRGRRAHRRHRRRPPRRPARPGRGRRRPGPTIDDLVARGLLVPARRDDRPPPSLTVPLWAGARLDRLLREVRG